MLFPKRLSSPPAEGWPKAGVGSGKTFTTDSNAKDVRSLLVCDIGFTCDIDGPGQRLMVYLKGCNLCCPWCGQPETIAKKPEMLFYANRAAHTVRVIRACPHGAIVLRNGKLTRVRHICAVCAGLECLASKISAFEWVGRQMTIGALVAMAERYRPFFGRQGGVTIGGGEPTCQFDNVRRLLAVLKQKRFSTALETNGTDLRLADIFPYLDFLFIDLKHPDNTICKAITGQGNANVIKNIKARFRQKKPLRVRIPLIPGFNDQPATLAAFGRILSAIGHIEVEVLPFHRRGEVKWNALGQAMPCGSLEIPAPEALRAAGKRLTRCGLKVITL